jgi:hypothetical protein
MTRPALLLVLLSACVPEARPDLPLDAPAMDAPRDGAEPSDAGACVPEDVVPFPDGGPPSLRGARYCEVVLARPGDGGIEAEVYNTLGLSECPEAAWQALDARALAAEAGALMAVLNGPRYWLLDGFTNSEVLDPAVRTFGCLPMRLGGRVVLAGPAMPYAPLTVRRDTTFVFAAGRAVYELVDPEGGVWIMQSYSAQVVPQTEAELATLGARLALPAGWSFRTRTLEAELLVTARGGLATVTQDELQNTYQRASP